MARRSLGSAVLVAAVLIAAGQARGAGDGGGSGGVGGSGGGAGEGMPGSAAVTPGKAPPVEGLFTRPTAKPGQPKAQKAVPTCGAGFVLKAGSCVRVRAGVLGDGDLYAQGRLLAVRGWYAEALPILDAIQRTDDSMVWTMRGFATRKLGRVEEGMALYEKALAIDPNNLNTHEYKGEVFVTAGRLDLARVELATLERLCGRTCEQYEDLARAIETGQPEGPEDDEDA
ncbi:tetratricopeptide repeat protein [Alsobacter sp. R-9]